jgi:hypothetical protein
VDVGAWVWGWSGRRYEITLCVLGGGLVVLIYIHHLVSKDSHILDVASLLSSLPPIMNPRQTLVIGETAEYLKRGSRTTSAIDP